jgi:hypothetical protein
VTSTWSSVTARLPHLLQNRMQTEDCHVQDTKGEWEQWLDESNDRHAARLDRLDYDSMKGEVCSVQPCLHDGGQCRGTVTGCCTRACVGSCGTTCCPVSMLPAQSSAYPTCRCQDLPGLRGRMPPTQDYAPLHNEVLHNEAVSSRPYPDPCTVVSCHHGISQRVASCCSLKDISLC